ncbi:MAG: hypothetical protein JSC189_000478 [Candidatus Tokpelaia sp. JSC189]|nr:MAG: hypothetical protein JSC189_000478 [Candidatus Tokpelaia sp. JSC189]
MKKGESVPVEEKWIPFFKTGKELRDRLNSEKKMTIKRIFAFIILVPIAGLLIAFIVANRVLVRLAFNPFNPNDSAFTAPFFVWLFIFLAIGIGIGSITTWFSQYKHRKAGHGRGLDLKERHDKAIS